MSQHTPEPWLSTIDPVYGRFLNITTQKRIDAGLPCLIQVDGYSDDPEIEAEQHANARRIVACVNRLASFATEDIEDPDIDLFGTSQLQTRANLAEAHLAAASAQRDEFMDVLTLALPYVEAAETDPGYKAGAVAKMVARMKAAIAKVEQPS